MAIKPKMEFRIWEGSPLIGILNKRK